MTTEAIETVQTETETSPPPVVITRRHLAAIGACHEQRELFAKTFGPGAKVEVTEANARKALDAGLDLFWLAHGMGGAYSDAFCTNVCSTYEDRQRETAYETTLISEFVRLYTAQARGEPA